MQINFRQKFWDFEGYIRWWFNLGRRQGQSKVTEFLNESFYFVLRILVAYLENFLKHYNQVHLH